jgi:hypothetical protein
VFVFGFTVAVFCGSGNLPDRERTICMKLLLRMSMKDEIFEEEERAQVQEWYSLVEGSRKRAVRQDVNKPAATPSTGPRPRGRPPLPKASPPSTKSKRK